MDASYFEPKPYNVRSGATDLGRDYEYNIAALLCARCIAQNVEDMWIVSNCDQVGAFDDVVLNVRRPEGNSATFMIQLKHKAKPTNITKEEFVPVKNPNAKKPPKGDFFLEKYLKDIKELKKKIETGVGGVVAEVGAFSNVQFVIFTNRDVFPYDFLETVRPSAFLNTNNAVVYKFDFGKLSLLDPFFNDSDCGTNLFLYPKQLNVTAVAKEIVGEIKNIFGALGVKLVNAENIAREFTLYVMSWAKGDLGKHYYLTKREVVGKLCELFFRQFEVNLSLQRFTSYDCPKKLMWNEVIRNQHAVLVDADDLTLQFLFDYLGSEVRMVCNQGHLDNWSDVIEKEDESLFYQPGNEELKWQLLKVVGKHKRVNALEVYRTLVLTKKVPLVLKTSNLDEYENVLRVLPVSDFKIIMVNSTGSLKQSGNLKIFETLQDLPQESKSKILELPVKLQGRRTILRKLVNEHICKLIKCKDVIDILLGNFNIGNEFPDLPPYFVKRSIVKVLIDSKILQNNLDDIILIEENGENLPALQLEEIDFKSAKGAIRTASLAYITREQKQHIMDSSEKNVHYFKLYDAHHFEWKWSLRSIESLTPFVSQTLEDFNDLLDDYFNNNLNVISASPGMGKTILMDYLAHQAPESSWVLRINLNICQFRQYYSNTDQNSASGHLRFFNAQLDENKSALAYAVFHKFLREKKLIVIFDGFDEVSFSFTEEVTKIAKAVHRDGFPLWILTRPQGKAHLQSQFNTLALNLKPFNLDDQIFFLRRYFGVLNPGVIFPTFLLEGFITELLETAQKNLKDRDTVFAGIPLHCQLLAEVFNEEFIEYVKNNGEEKFAEDFDLLGLYEKMIDKKSRILSEKFGAGSVDMRSKFKHHQSLLAIKFLHPQKCLEGSYVQEQLNDFSAKDLELLQMDGIMSVNGRRKISCVHRTFAEYLLVQFIVNNLRNKDERVREIIHCLINVERFIRANVFLMEMFDSMVAKGNSLALRSLHLAIRKREPTTIQRIIQTDPNVLTERDSSGRSFLHLLALNATKFPFPYDPNYVPTHKYKSDGFADIIATLPETDLTLEEDLLGFTPFDYAISNRSLHLAALICDIGKPLTTNAFIRIDKFSEIGSDCLKYSVQLNSKLLFNILLPQFGMFGISVLSSVAPHTCKLRFSDDLIINELGAREVSCVELLQTKFGALYSGYANGCYSNLCIAIIVGSKTNVKTILTSNRTCINQIFFNFFTPLSCAALKGKAEIIDTLLLSGAKINAQNFCGDTPLSEAILGFKAHHGAAQEPYLDTIAKLLRSGSNVNTQTLIGSTCLHTLLDIYGGKEASSFSEEREKMILNLLKLLIDTGADVNIRNNVGCTPLHIAAQNMLDKSVEYLLNSGADVNALDSNGDSSLWMVLYKGYELLVQEADRLRSNASYKSNHHWINNQKEKITRKLLERGANVNHKNRRGETALHMATLSSQTPGCKDVEVLLQNGADVNIQNYDTGNKALHLIILLTLRQQTLPNPNVYELLISKDSDVNVQNEDGDTPLHLIPAAASAENASHVIALLLRKGADGGIKNRKGESALELLQANKFEASRNDREVPAPEVSWREIFLWGLFALLPLGLALWVRLFYTQFSSF